MGYLVKQYVDGIEECPKCKSKKFRVLETIYRDAFADLENGYFTEFSEQGDNLGDSNYSVICQNCGELIQERD